MMTKTVKPIMDAGRCAGTIVEYRVFGLLIYRKTLMTPLISEDERTWFIYQF